MKGYEPVIFGEQVTGDHLVNAQTRIEVIGIDDARVALIVYCLSSYAAAPAVEFLAAAAGKRKWPVKTEEEVAAMVEDIFLKADLHNPKDLAAAREGVRFSEQWRLAEWVRRLNFGGGVAPSSGLKGLITYCSRIASSAD